MESTLYTFLVVSSLLFLDMEEQGDLRLITPVLLLLVALTRTEVVVFYLAVAGLRVSLSWLAGDRRYSMRRGKFVLWNGIFLEAWLPT